MIDCAVNCRLTGEKKAAYLAQCELANLEYLLVYRKYKSPCTPFRTFIDNWYAYHKRGPFLNRNLKPHWFNKPHPVKHRKALLSMEFVSQNARVAIESGEAVHLVKDHSIPVVTLREMFLDLELTTTDDIRKFLIEKYCLGVITKSEDQNIDARKLRFKMPENWNGTDAFARYSEVGIQ